MGWSWNVRHEFRPPDTKYAAGGWFCEGEWLGLLGVAGIWVGGVRMCEVLGKGVGPRGRFLGALNTRWGQSPAEGVVRIRCCNKRRKEEERGEGWGLV